MQNQFPTLRAPFWLVASAAILASGCTQRKEPLSLQQPIQSVQNVGATGRALPVADSTPPPLPELQPVSSAQAQLLKQAKSEAAAWATQFVDKNGKVAAPVGLIVAEPRTEKNGKDEARQFAAGCARWLHLNASGQGELGATPLWGQPDDARQQLKRKTLQFGSDDLPILAQHGGASHVALGQWQENNGRATLTYELWRTAPPTKTGQSLGVSGNRAQIVAQLPALAAKISRATGAKTPIIPAKVGATPDELSFLGAVPWKADAPIDAAQTKRLQVLAAREPLAGLLVLRDGELNYEQAQKTVAQLLKSAPLNTLAVGDVGWLYGYQLARAANAPILKTAQQKYPRNFLIAMASSLQNRATGDRQAQGQWLETAVRSAPRNGLAWLNFSYRLYDQSQEVRQYRYASQINSREWKYLQVLYPQTLNTALEATRLAAHNVDAWRAVSSAAAFNSQNNLAQAAFWKALNVDPHNAAVLKWGMELFQSKWGGSRRDLLWVAQRSEADPKVMDEAYYAAIGALHEDGLEPEMEAMRDRMATHYQSVAKNSKDANPHLRLAYLSRDFYHDEQLPVAARSFENYLKTRPDDAATRLDYGRMLHYKMRLYRKAERNYQRVLELEPNNSGALCALADLTYYVHRKTADAEAMYRRAIAIDDYQWAHVELARLLLDQGKKGEAYRETQAAVAAGLTSGDNPIFERLKTPIETFQAAERDSWQY